MASSASGTSSFWFDDMDSFPTTTGVLLFSFLALLTRMLWNFIRRREGEPPGPWGVPILGYLPFLSHEPHLDLYKLFKKYGDIFSFRVPGYNVVVLNTFDAVREAFVKQGDKFLNLPTTFTVVKWFSDNKGVGSDGPEWQEQRRFALRTLKDFGFGRMVMEPDIHDGVRHIIREFHDHSNKPFAFKPTISLHTGNVVTKVTFGKTFEAGSAFISTIREAAMSLTANQLLPGMEAFRPMEIIGKYIPLSVLPKFRHFVSMKNKVRNLTEKIIEEHERDLDPSNPQDFTDIYLIKMKRVSEGTDEGSFYSRDHLRSIITAMLFAGLDTTTEMIAWAIKVLCIYPDVQKKVQAEIDQVIGKDRLPSYADSLNTPYATAVINEIHRFASLLPVTFYFQSIDEGKVCGYKIPKDTLLLANLFAIHRDPRIWLNPNQFDPQNMIGPDGKPKKDGFIPFFTGKRSCLGEILAKMVLYIVVASLFQRFSIRLEDNERPSLETCVGMTRTLPEFQIVATPRM